jgi:hypothetical protein
VEANGPEPYFRTERSGPGLRQVPTPSGSVFLVIGLVLLPLAFWQAAVALASRPPQLISGPENVQCRAVFIQTRELWFLRGRTGPTRYRLTARSNRL